MPSKVMTANQVVSYRLREARRLRGWTQDEAGAHLAPYLGVRWSPASFSAAERAMDRTRGREFTADEMVALARGFGLPLLLFLLLPPGARLASADGGPASTPRCWSTR